MNGEEYQRVGFSCSYAPLPLIDAAGFVPYRILPLGSAPDQAGSLLHDNMCPHVKRVLDRALAADLPQLAGVVFMNSCDAMRRLADAWQIARPTDRTILVDLPSANDDGAVVYFAAELARLADELSRWSGRPLTPGGIARSAARYRDLASALDGLGERAAARTLPGGRRAFQELLNRSVTMPLDETLAEVRCLEAAPGVAPGPGGPVPLYLFGNVLPDAEAFDLFHSCGALVVADDVCTGSRQIVPLECDGEPDGLRQIARGLLRRPACARTMEAGYPGTFAQHVVRGAKDCGARGVIAHVMKFCDPYLVRLPGVRDALQKIGLPLLILEGDCTLRSLGQHRTRIEAFVEMLGGCRS
jgi:benzoyl-CoA reductase/2-hydroxyglutaryl-CoA dehydratase subunit BcrC/BadD/HgdB